MKAFENWWEKHRASIAPHTCQSARRENLGMIADRYIWRACVEWVLEELEKEESFEIFQARIKKELE